MSDGTGPLAPRLHRLRVDRVLGIPVRVAEDPLARLLGLALLEREQAGTGLLLPGCRSVHTIGMRFAIDVLFLDRDDRPLRLCARVRPGRFRAERRAHAVLELPCLDLPRAGEHGRGRRG